MTITPSVEKFIEGWAEMACKWSVNRSVAKVHALFYLSADRLCAEDVSNALSVSRSDVSADMSELEGLGLIRPVHFCGDRKQYYETIMSPWAVFRIILDGRKRGSSIRLLKRSTPASTSRSARPRKPPIRSSGYAKLLHFARSQRPCTSSSDASRSD